jgi:predicted transcriptional regulator
MMPASVKLDPELKTRLDALAKTKQRSPHWLMRQAIQEYVDREQARDAFYREALDSWTRYRETGEHLTLAEANAWLDTWGTDDESPPSPCHK